MLLLKSNVISAISGSNAAWSLTQIRSPSQMNYCNIPPLPVVCARKTSTSSWTSQDTDPTQFSVLTEITRPPDATGLWLETKTAPPRPVISAWSAIFSSG